MNDPQPSGPSECPGPSPARGLRAHAVLVRGDFRLDAELSVGAGEVLAVLGPNGAGKTTLLRILAGLLAVTGGSVTVDEQIWDDADAGIFVPAPRRAAGLVFQDYRLFPHLDVLDNIAFAARARGVRRARARAEAAEMADRFGLGELSARRPGELSGGQAQRVALARALASRPRMLLLDEPLAALDARTRLELRTELRRRLSAFDGPSIVVTHDPLEALVLADRILVLEAGRIVQSGTPAEVARHPATEYVARLMGLNLYSGHMDQDRIALDGGGTLVTTASRSHEPVLRERDSHGQVLREPDLREPGPRVVGAVLVVLAPAAISVHRERPGPGSPRNVWAGRVDGLELLTDRVRLAVTGPPDALVDVTPAAVAELGLASGQEVWLSAKATEVIAYPRPAG